MMPPVHTEISRLPLLAGLLLLAGLASCTQTNPQFCSTAQDCAGTDRCVANVCEAEAPAPDGDVPDLGAPDASLDVAGSCPQETHQCVPQAPAGWNGPAIRSDGQAGDTPPACPAGFEGGEELGFHGLQAEGSCGCSCGETTTLACSTGAIEGRDGPGGFQACFAGCTAPSCVRQVLPNGSCAAMAIGVKSADLWRLDVGVVTGGTCGAGSIENNLQEPSFDSQTILCHAQPTFGGCDDNSVCAAKAPAAFSEQTCISREGVHDCPLDSVFTERLVRFEDYDDQRSCSTCDCSVPTGGGCGSIETYLNDSSCTGAPSSPEICADNPNSTTAGVIYRKDDSRPCIATANPPVDGAVTGVGAMTLCCTAG